MKQVKRILSLVLLPALCVQLLPAPTLADATADPSQKPSVIATSEGESIGVEESWEAAYSYGVFLFADGQANVTEGGGAVEIPEDLDLSPERSFSALELDSADPYASYVFAMTFADGEWVKYIRVAAPEDTAAEAMKFATFTLLDCEGGACCPRPRP